MVIEPKQPWKQVRRTTRMPIKPTEPPLVAPGAMFSAVGLGGPLVLAFLVLISHGCKVTPVQADDAQATQAPVIISSSEITALKTEITHLKEHDELMAEAIKTLGYEVDVLTRGYMDKDSHKD